MDKKVLATRLFEKDNTTALNDLYFLTLIEKVVPGIAEHIITEDHEEGYQLYLVCGEEELEEINIGGQDGSES